MSIPCAKKLKLLRVGVHLSAQSSRKRNWLQRQPQIACVTLLLQELGAHVSSLLQRCERKLLLSSPSGLFLRWLQLLSLRCSRGSNWRWGGWSRRGRRQGRGILDSLCSVPFWRAHPQTYAQTLWWWKNDKTNWSRANSNNSKVSTNHIQTHKPLMMEKW